MVQANNVDPPNNHFEKLLADPHPDVDYLRQQDISLVLSKALADTFKAQPLEPKMYFAKYLLNYAAQKRQETAVSIFKSSRYNNSSDNFCYVLSA